MRVLGGMIEPTLKGGLRHRGEAGIWRSPVDGAAKVQKRALAYAVGFRLGGPPCQELGDEALLGGDEIGEEGVLLAVEAL